MNKISRIRVLCEDGLHDFFVSRFLKKWGLKRDRNFFVNEDYPKEGEGAGSQFVRENYPDELKACRARQAKTALIVVIDADNNSLQQRHEHLNQKCQAAGLASQSDSDLVVYVIPKWHIETWLAWLDGNSVEEEYQGSKKGAGYDEYKKVFDGYKNRYGGKKDRKAKFRKLVEDLAEKCRNKTPLDNAPASLVATCKEFDRIREMVK